MSGHNKWTQIKRQKERTDTAKSKIFGKYAKLITDAARKARGNSSDPALKAAIEKARSFNMPNENIERAIKRATETEEAMERVIYEAYGPGGCALIIEVLTSNRNKTAQEIKHILSEQGFALASPGSAAWAFSKTAESYSPQTTIPLSEEDLKKLKALADALEASDEVQEVFSNAE
ncbi:MAG: YebC/PmpR family DNA-binding transcriptional regulator [Candidatus Taylorbacteria bacterium]|nr:YebC/PmpR family DNA-binding transcriptional regulator [Candidatus Taylorbacteria bacterium]